MTVNIPSQTVPSQLHTRDVVDITHDKTVTCAEGLRAIDAAVPIMRALELRVELYRAFVSRYDDILHVSFIDKSVPIGRFTRGNPGNIPGVEVHLNPIDFVPIGSNLIR